MELKTWTVRWVKNKLIEIIRNSKYFLHNIQLIYLHPAIKSPSIKPGSTSHFHIFFYEESVYLEECQEL
jgi:hypothetical protein